jgi:hypothetical protein
MNSDFITDVLTSKDDVIYFTENFIKIIHPVYGLIDLKLYDFQKEILNAYSTDKKVFVKSIRQSGKTLCNSIFALWYALFNGNKHIRMVAQNHHCSDQIRNIVVQMVDNLPEFFQTVTRVSKQCIEFKNGSKITFSNGDPIHNRGCRFDVVIYDEPYEKNFFGWLETVIPIMSSDRKLLLCGTFDKDSPIGDYFNCTEQYTKIKVKWDQVPGRDQNFKSHYIKLIGYRNWYREFE